MILMSSLDIRRNINVVIYSFKGKNLKETVQNLLENSSLIHNISLQIFDQSPLTRNEYFNQINNCQYIHIFWDHITSPCKYKSNSIKNSNFDYTLILSDSILLKKNWDAELVSFVGNKNIIVSGKNSINLLQETPYYLKQTQSQSEFFSLNNWIDRDLIFGQTTLLKMGQYPEYLKYNGEEEVLSMTFFCNGIDVYSTPNNFYNNIDINTIKTTYHTFSEDHNYNECVSLIKTGQNNYINLNGLARTPEEFCSIHNISRDTIKPLPFLKDDVHYDPHTSPFDKVDSKKFMTKVNYIA
jgi:hypothetical protein